MSPWRPIVEGELARRCLAAARDVVDALCEHEPTNPPDIIDYALFWAYAAGAFEAPRYDEQQELAMDRLAALLEGEQLGPQLFGGYAGAAWVLNHVSGVEEEDDDEVGDMLDEALVELLDVESWQQDYDLIGGLVGIGVHFLDRLPREKAKRGLARVVGHLEALGEKHGELLTWHTRAELLPAWQRERSPTGYYNVGLAHGVPGVVALLAAMFEEGEGTPTLEAMLRGAVNFVASTEGTDPAGRYPSSIATLGGSGGEARTAWCYGDPGVAIALWRAASSLADDELSERALRLANECATRPVEACSIIDAGLCHGRAGLGHVLNRLYQASGDEVLRASASAWFERTLNERRDDGIAGFPANVLQRGWVAAPGILEGAGGVALALISAATDIEPGWDRMMLIDLPVH